MICIHMHLCRLAEDMSWTMGNLVYNDDAPSQQTHQLDFASVDATHDVEEQPQEVSIDREASGVETQAATSHSTDGNRPPTSQLLEALQQEIEIELPAPMLPVEVNFLIHFSNKHKPTG